MLLVLNSTMISLLFENIKLGLLSLLLMLRFCSKLTNLLSAETFDQKLCDAVLSGNRSVLRGTQSPHHQVGPNKPTRVPCAQGDNMVLLIYCSFIKHNLLTFSI